MGDRLTITDERGNDIFYGTKLFGYVGDLKNSQSLMFLWSLECVRKSYIDFDDFKLKMEIVCEYQKIGVLTRPQLEEFLRLYNFDLQKYRREGKVEITIPNESNEFWLEWG